MESLRPGELCHLVQARELAWVANQVDPPRAGEPERRPGRPASCKQQACSGQEELLALVKRHRSQLLAEVGCGPLTAAIMIGWTPGAQRFSPDASFALEADTAPIKCSSGHIMDRA